MILLILLLIGSVFGEENVLCTNDYCKDVKCPPLSAKCQAQNVTHNGVLFISPSTCNCCQFCLDNLGEGEECSTGDISDPVPNEICGPGLYCTPANPNNINGICLRMDTNCTKLQVDFDERKRNGSLGTMEVYQECDSEGEFVSYKCIPGQTCYCVDPKGNRIFGESDVTSLPEINMNCKCSRDYVEAVALIGRELNPFEHFHCASNGDYEKVQCIGDQCLCVDAYDGAPTYSDDPTVNMTQISNSTLNCYKNKEDGVYYKSCELEYVEALEGYERFEKGNNYNMLLGFEFPKCDLDGTYQAVQENQTHKYCVDKEGIVLTAVDKTMNATLADSMDCKCVRASLIMTNNDKPSCGLNGNYLPVQCRRGICRCVDKNGNQLCKQVNCEVEEILKDTLKCT